MLKEAPRDEGLWNNEAREGRIWIHREIDRGLGFSVAAHLDSLERDGNTKEILMDINSFGGDIAATMSMIHRMLTMRTSVVTSCSGVAFSAGLLLVAGGDHRRAYPYSRFLFHGGSTAFGYQKAQQHLEDALEMVRVDEMISDYMAMVTKKNKKHWMNLCTSGKDVWIPVEQALEWGIIDEVVSFK